MVATSSSTIFHSSPRLRRSVSHASGSSSTAAACRNPACSRPSAWPPAPAQISTAVSWAIMSSRLHSAGLALGWPISHAGRPPATSASGTEIMHEKDGGRPMVDIHALAAMLQAAQVIRATVPPLTETYDGLTLDD